MTKNDVRRMTFLEKFKYLERKVITNECDGDCDIDAPYVECDGCISIRVLNNFSEEMYYVIRDMEKL